MDEILILKSRIRAFKADELEQRFEGLAKLMKASQKEAKILEMESMVEDLAEGRIGVGVVRDYISRMEEQESARRTVRKVLGKS